MDQGQRIYRFERKRLGNKTLTSSYGKYGSYLYRDTITNHLIASWEKPTNDPSTMYSGYDIGTNTDALEYYKNT